MPLSSRALDSCRVLVSFKLSGIFQQFFASGKSAWTVLQYRARYRAITSSHYRRAVGALLVYDVTRQADACCFAISALT